MHDRIKEAFDQVSASEELKTQTRDFLAERTDRLARHPFLGMVRLARLIPAALFTIFLLLCGGYYLYFIPTVTISIDINPSLELSINRFDRVISVNGYNSDGDALADSLNIRFMNCQDAVSELLENENVTDLLAQDEMMAITVGGSNDGQCSRILEDIQTCTKSHEENTHCYTATADETHEAHSMGLSCGKYKAYQELQTLDPDITPEEVNEMTMREIYDRIASLSGENQERSPSHHPEHESGSKKGYRHGHHE